MKARMTKYRKQPIIAGIIIFLLLPLIAYSAGYLPATISLLLKSDRVINAGSIYGQVKDTEGNNVEQVSVIVSGIEATRANDLGYFSVPGMEPSDRVTVVFAKEGYVSTTVNAQIQKNLVTYINPILAPAGQTTTYTGEELTLNHAGGSITIPAGSLVDREGRSARGPATAAFTAFDPTVPSQREAFPGDFEGRTFNGTDSPVLSYGFFDMTVKAADGSRLQLAQGETATFTMPIPASVVATAPATMPLWYFNEDNGRWEEQGVVTKEGNNYVGSVPHFSIWNNDAIYESTTVKGRITQNGLPIQGATVVLYGQNWDNTDWSTTADGTFSLDAEPEADISLLIKKGDCQSDLKQITSLGAGLALDLGDLEFTCVSPPAVFTLTWGKDPYDLDSHLWTPDGTNIYFNNKGGNGAELDYDDTDSFGPEHITIRTPVDGEYLYSVHWYAGEGTWATSGGAVVLTVDGLGSYTLRAPESPKGDYTYWDLWKLTVQNGQITSVTELNRVVDDSSHQRGKLEEKSAEYRENHK